QAGPVITVKIPKDRDGRPKQFAFVNFKHEESVPYGLRLLNGIKLYGRPMRIQFRSGSSHAAQDTNPSCSQLGAAGANPPGMPHPASNCSRYESHQHGSVGWSWTWHGSPCSWLPPSAVWRFFPRFGDPDYGRGKRDEYGFDERGHEAEHHHHHHHRGGREEHYDDRHRDSWSYEYRRESYREAKWHSARH
ncbi:RBM7 protein, partial [Regulus satrapa]|nr:RBM7 protein [Regulus satrapa]